MSCQGLVLALGIPERSFELGHTMIFFRHGAATKLLALDSLTREELATVTRRVDMLEAAHCTR